ncbi:MAG TPA: MBL fold metallo-hydrolase [Hyphomonadaceae bacterium]|nr:MBL fold metallo-hydrolase [Hyphomonadaceae bacterium]HPN04905.1 MBL fold metallo-hydrolase [Hyphomonadaceae bacterium]
MRILLLTCVAGLALAACATTEATAPVTAVATAPVAAAPAAQPAPNSQAFARVVELGSGVSMLIGQGGNLGVSVGDDGVFLIDDQYATNAAVNLAKIEELTKGKPKYLINTHWHFDHAGGNEVFGGAGATIFASDKVRKRLTGEIPSQSRGAPTVPAAKVALPVVTFVDGIDFHLNGQTIRAIRAPLPAHTDGDTLIYFVEADVLHTGDTYMKDRYPFVDTGSGGTQAGFIAAIEKAVSIAGPNTKVIPGHGELATKADLQAALDMHKGARAAVEAQVKAGKTLEQTIAAKPLAQWTPRFGAQGGFITDDAYVTVIYNELKK